MNKNSSSTNQIHGFAYFIISVAEAFSALHSRYSVSCTWFIQLFVFGLASLFGHIWIVYSAHCSAVKRKRSKYLAQP